MDPAAGQPEHGSAESYAGMIRDIVAGDIFGVSATALGIIESIVNADRGTDADRFTQVRNVLTAARQVWAELR